jgi:hypothetical protein
MAFSNTGVLSIDGSTGAITNVARTDVNNLFSTGQNISGTISSYDSGVDHSIMINPSLDKIIFRNETSENQLDLYAGDNFNNQVIAFPQSSTTLAGLAVNQSFSGTNTFDARTNFAAGISAAGGVTFSGNFSGATGSFSRLLTASAGISAAGGVTLAGTLRGTTSSFTGLVSSTVGFSGPGTNITGVVTSFNNQTGVVTGVTVGGTNVFTALNSFNAGISAAGGITFSAPISSTRMARHTSAAISAQKTADFTPTAAEDGTVFYINYSGKGSLIVTLDGLPIGWRAKFLNVGNGQVLFESTGDVYGYGPNIGLEFFMLEAICIDTNTYFVG